MGKTRKDDAKPKREKAPVDSDSDDDDDDARKEEEEEIESEAARKKRERGRSAFMSLLRKPLALIPLALVLSRQPFVMRPRQSGVNALKFRPLDAALMGMVHWGLESPTAMRNPSVKRYINETGRVLLTPYEYFAAQQSKRAMPAEKTASGAYKKAAKSFGRVVDKDAALRDIVTAPMPNTPLIGSYALLASALLCPLVGGLFEYGIILGCFALLQGGRQLGMEPQPELYVTGAMAVGMILLSEAAAKGAEPTKKKRKRR